MELSESQRLNEVNWHDVLPRLLLYTKSIVKAYRLEDIVSAEELTQNAVYALLSGRRRWPPDVSLLTALIAIVRSNISHQVYLKRDYIDTEKLEILADETRGPYYKAEDNEFRKNILALVGNDKDLVRLVEIYLEDSYSRPKDIAEALGVSLDDVYNLRKRLRRRLSTMRQKQ
jgi:DNA-directed RNA polymerase specialized sigma24 family protein